LFYFSKGFFLFFSLGRFDFCFFLFFFFSPAFCGLALVTIRGVTHIVLLVMPGFSGYGLLFLLVGAVRGVGPRVVWFSFGFFVGLLFCFWVLFAFWVLAHYFICGLPLIGYVVRAQAAVGIGGRCLLGEGVQVFSWI